MPRKPFDPRILMLANQAETQIKAFASLEPRPDTVTPPDPDGPGYPWGWSDVVVMARFADQEHEAILHGMSYTGQREFMRSEAYQTALHTALSGLLARLDKAAEAAAKLGPRVKEGA